VHLVEKVGNLFPPLRLEQKICREEDWPRGTGKRPPKIPKKEEYRRRAKKRLLRRQGRAKNNISTNQRKTKETKKPWRTQKDWRNPARAIKEGGNPKKGKGR